jgi:hypothetical protein
MDVPADVSGQFEIVITLLAGGDKTQVLTAHARTTLIVENANPVETTPRAEADRQDRNREAAAKKPDAASGIKPAEEKSPVATAPAPERHAGINPSSVEPTSRVPTRSDGEQNKAVQQVKPTEKNDPSVATPQQPRRDGPQPPSAEPTLPAPTAKPADAGPAAPVPSAGASVTPAGDAKAPQTGQDGGRAAPQVPTLTAEERARAERFIARGERDLQDGNVALARLSFQRAAEAGHARAALLLAATYDPRELANLGVLGVQPDATLARHWYERARALGAPEAKERLARLAGE